MSHTSVRTALGVTFAALTVLTAAANLSAESPRVVVRLYDASAGDPSVRAAAMRTASAILEEAGISADWLDCTDVGAGLQTRPDVEAGLKTRLYEEDLNLIVRIMPTLAAGSRLPGTAVRAHGIGLPDLPLGFAVVDPRTRLGSMATIFRDQVLTVAQRTGVERSELLGRALAHEVGHLLLGVTGHSATGLMRAVWSDAELTTNRREDWLFAPNDETRLRCHFVDATFMRNVPSSCRSR